MEENNNVLITQLASLVSNRIDGMDMNGESVVMEVLKEGETLSVALAVVEKIFGFKTWEEKPDY